jgi:hypothetical protein
MSIFLLIVFCSNAALFCMSDRLQNDLDFIKDHKIGLIPLRIYKNMIGCSKLLNISEINKREKCCTSAEHGICWSLPNELKKIICDKYYELDGYSYAPLLRAYWKSDNQKSWYNRNIVGEMKKVNALFNFFKINRKIPFDKAKSFYVDIENTIERFIEYSCNIINFSLNKRSYCLVENAIIKRSYEDEANSDSIVKSFPQWLYKKNYRSLYIHLQLNICYAIKKYSLENICRSVNGLPPKDQFKNAD